MATSVTGASEWEFLFANVLLEPDNNRLPERIAAAEAAINERSKALRDEPDSSEKHALVRALRALQLRRDRLIQQHSRPQRGDVESVPLD